MKWIKHLCASLMQNVRGTRKQFHKRLRIDSNKFFSCLVVDCCSKLSFELFGRSIGVNYRLKRTVCWCQHNNTSYLGGVVSPTDSMDYVNDAELTMISISRLGRSLSLGWCCSCESCVFRRQTDGMHTQHTIHYMPYSVNKQASKRTSKPTKQPTSPKEHTEPVKATPPISTHRRMYVCVLRTQIRFCWMCTVPQKKLTRYLCSHRHRTTSALLLHECYEPMPMSLSTFSIPVLLSAATVRVTSNAKTFSLRVLSRTLNPVGVVCKE